MNSLFFLFLLPYKDYFYIHKFDLANRYAQISFKVSPEGEVLYYQGIMNAILKNFDKAIDALEKLPQDDTYVNYYLTLSYFRLGEYERCKRYFKKEDDFPQLYYYRVLVCLKKGMIDEAKRYLNMALESETKRIYLKILDDYETLKDAREKYYNREYKEVIRLCSTIENFDAHRQLYLALSNAEIGEFKRSLVLLDSVIRYAPDSELVMEGVYQAGRINFILKNYEISRNYLKDYLSKKERPSARFFLGRIFTEENNFDSAYHYFKNLPDTIDEYLFFKGRTEYFLGQWQSAEEKLSRHRKFFPNSIYADRVTYILGSINFKRNEYQSAIDYWTDLINLYPKSIYAASALKGIGDAYFNLKKYKEALKSYKSVKDYKPSESLQKEVNLKIYETYYFLGRYPTLIEALRRFIEANPDTTESGGMVAQTQLRIARILYEKEEYYSALSELDLLIEKYPNSLIVKDVYLERARIYRVIGDCKGQKDALYSLLKVENAKDYYNYAINELGEIYKTEMKYDSALYYYNLLLNEVKHRELAIFEIAQIYSLLGRYGESDLLVSRLIDEYPKSGYLLDAIRLYVKSKKNQGDYQSALNFLKGMNSRTEPMPEVFFEIGNLYFEMKDYKSAYENYLLASECYKENRDGIARALIMAGDAMMALGDKKEAKNLYLKAGIFAQSRQLKDEATRKMAITNE